MGAEPRDGTAPVSVATTPSARIPRLTGWLGAVTSTDHKRIGLTLGVCSLFFFLLGGVFALLMRTQLAQSNMHLLSDNSYDELFTMHGSTMIYLFVTPMAIAMSVYLVPLADRRGAAGGPPDMPGGDVDLAVRGTGHAAGLVRLRWRRPGRVDLVRAAVERHQHAGGRTGPVGDRGDSRRRGDDR